MLRAHGTQQACSSLQGRVLRSLPAQPALNWLQIWCSLTMCRFKPPQSQLGAFWQCSTAPCRCHQIQTVLINRYSLWSYRQEKELLKNASAFLCAGSTGMQIHWSKTPTLPFHGGQRPEDIFQSLNWNNTYREPALNFCRWIPALLNRSGCLWREVNVPHQRTFQW